MSYSLQSRLLRVLQEHQVVRVGGNSVINIDVRVLTATNANLKQMIQDRQFREDLFFRLNVFPLQLIPLRKRSEDILPMFCTFAGVHPDSVSDRIRSKLLTHNWPGNIRELRNIIERAVIISNEDEIGPDALHLFTVEDRPETKSRVLDPVKDLKTAMEELELEYINHAYEKYGNVREAAESLGMTPSTFVRKRQKYTKNVD